MKMGRVEVCECDKQKKMEGEKKTFFFYRRVRVMHVYASMGILVEGRVRAKCAHACIELGRRRNVGPSLAQLSGKSTRSVDRAIDVRAHSARARALRI